MEGFESFLGKPEEVFTLVNSDTLFPAECLDRLREYEGSALVVAAKELDEEEMKVDVENGRVVSVRKDLERADGEYIGLCKFESEDATKLVDKLDYLIEAGRTNEWYETAFDRLVPDQSLEIVEVRDDWIEIDDRMIYARPSNFGGLVERVHRGNCEAEAVFRY